MSRPSLAQQIARSYQAKRPPSNALARFEQYVDDPVGFCVDVLGYEPWSRQREILASFAGPKRKRVAARSGHKISKSRSAASGALWFACTRPNARVILTAPTHRQIRNILWHEIEKLYNSAKVPLGGELHTMPENGLVWQDGRRIFGFFTTEPEKMAGISGENLLFIVDEASGYPDNIMHAIEGNRAGGAWLWMFSNPTLRSGYFFDAFAQKREFWHLHHVPSTEAADTGIPGLATWEWIHEKRAEWGEDSPLYQIRVLGNFPSQEETSIISVEIIEAALARWHSTVGEGRLEIGVDVARYGDDASCICLRRGRRVLSLIVLRERDGNQIAGRVMQTVRESRFYPGEKARVKVDVIGVGASVLDCLKQHDKGEIDLVAVDVSSKPLGERNQKEYLNLRAQLWYEMRSWLRSGGAIPRDDMLESELASTRYDYQRHGSKLIVEPKDNLKKRLGRSPDRADALALAIFERPVQPFRATPVRSRYAIDADD